MKRFFSVILLFIMLLSFRIAARAEEESYGITVRPPDQTVYYIGEPIRYNGGYIDYHGPDADEIFALTNEVCSGYRSDSPGVRHITVRIKGYAAVFSVAVLTPEEPVLESTDLYDDHWSFASFAKCMKAGILTGYDKQLRPNAAITRAEMAQLIYNAAAENTLLMAEKPDAPPSFGDTPADAWYFEAVEACRKAEILYGNESGDFDPLAPVKREDALLLIARMRFGEKELEKVDVAARLEEYPIRDFNSVSEYAKAGVAAVLGIAVGDENGDLHPRDPLTRAEAAVLFANLFIPDPAGWTAPHKPAPVPKPEPDPKPEPKPEPEPEPPRVPLVYLSPENRTENVYTGVNANESDEMYRVANAVKALLEARGYRVVLPDRSVGIRERGPAANEMGADMYIAIHSNAGGGEGTCAFYNGTYTAGAEFQNKYRSGKATNRGSRELATEIFNRVAAISPGDERTASEPLKEDYVCLMTSGGTPFVEVRLPEMANVLLEVEYHDIAPYARWIVAHTAEIADSIAAGAIAYWEKYAVYY